MTYISNTDDERREMLGAIGVGDVSELFTDVPEAHRFPELQLPPPLSEMEVLRELGALAEKNLATDRLACFLGAGAYQHFIPSIVDFLLRRSEFFTAYTPYQPEISQGTLQAHFEYQSMLAALTGMEAANVSHYDGATAAAEAVIMAMSVARGKRKGIVVSPTLHPQYRAVIRTYTQGLGDVMLGEAATPGDLPALAEAISEDTAIVLVQNPDFLGRLYRPAEMRALAERAHAAHALFAVAAHPISLGLLKPPGQYGADIVFGEGQPLGNALSFGGPYLGFFATSEELVRKTAGRIVGETIDAEGQRGFVLTLSSREQHIRREKATSNICSNQALNALAAAIYLASMGKSGLRTVAELCYHKAHYAAEQISRLPGYALAMDGPFFNEFVVRCPRPVAEINTALRERHGILGGYDLEVDYHALAGHQLFCVTEMNGREEIDRLVLALGELS